MTHLSDSSIWSPSNDIVSSNSTTNTELTMNGGTCTRCGQWVDTSLMRELLKCSNKDGEVSSILGVFKHFEDRAKKVIAENSMTRAAEFEAKLEQVCEEGRQAEWKLGKLRRDELEARRGVAQRENAYSKALGALGNAREASLGRFFTRKDAQAKQARIDAAQQALDAAIADMEAHPNEIPDAVFAVQDAERHVSALGARERELRQQIAALTGQPAHTDSHDSNGLQV